LRPLFISFKNRIIEIPYFLIRTLKQFIVTIFQAFLFFRVIIKSFATHILTIIKLYFTVS